MAGEYLQSVNEYAVYREEMGRYYDTRKACAVDTQEGVRRVIYSSNAYDTNAEGIKGGIELLDKENNR